MLEVNKRGLLLRAANKMFARHGYGNTTLRDIAQEAGVNQALVSYHFKGKEGLYLATLEQLGQSRLLQVRALLKNPANFEEFKVRLQIFADDFLNCCLDETDTFRMLNREFENEESSPEFEEIFKKTYMQTFQTLVKFFAVAKQNKIIRQDSDPALVTNIVFSTLNNFVRLEPLSRKFFGGSIKNPQHREKMVEQFMQLIIGGLSPQ